MDFLNRAYSQLYDLYRSMTPGSRLTAGLLAAVVLLGVGYLFTHQVSAPDVDLMHGVPVVAGQLPAMEAAFAKANLKGYEVRGASIFVPRGQESAYMAALADAKALPLNFGDALREAISAGNPFENSRQRDQRNKIALQAELSLIIRSMTGIESAYVLYDVDSKPGFNKDKLITATVSVRPASSGQLDETRVAAIRDFVVKAIAGLKPENVAVSDLNSGRTWCGNLEEGGSAEGNFYVSQQRIYEQDLKAKILHSLCYIPNVTVETNVELAHERITRMKQTKRAANPAKDRAGGGARSLNKDSRTSPSGASSQQPNTAAVLKALLGGSSSADDGSETDGTGPVADEQVEKEGVGLTPTSAKVSVGVPISYFRKVWQERNPVEAGRAAKTPDQAALDQIRIEESAKIQRHVAQLLPSPESVAKAAELVTVTTFQDIPVQEPPAPAFSEDMLSWLRQSWRMLGMIALALVGLLMLRSIARPRPAAADVPTTSPNADRDDDAVGDGPSAVPPPHARRFFNAGEKMGTGASPHAHFSGFARAGSEPVPVFSQPLREELSELVEDDPDAAANVLRSWIGQVDQ